MYVACRNESSIDIFIYREYNQKLIHLFHIALDLSRYCFVLFYFLWCDFQWRRIYMNQLAYKKIVSFSLKRTILRNNFRIIKVDSKTCWN